MDVENDKLVEQPGEEKPELEQPAGSENGGQHVADSKPAPWTSQLPKALREKFKDEDIPTQTDLALGYLELKQKLAEKGSDTKKYTEEDYKDVSSFFDSDEGSADQKLFAFLKESNVEPSKLKSVCESMMPTEEDKKIRIEIAKTQVKDRLHKMWGDKAQENERLYNAAMKELYTEEQRNAISRSGLQYNEFFVDAVARVGKLNKEGVMPNSSFGNKPKTVAEIMGWK